MATSAASLAERAALHRVLGDERRLAVVDELRRSDRTPTELGRLTGMGSNLLAHHLDELEAVGLVRRVRSEGDARRRYVQLVTDPGEPGRAAGSERPDAPPLFVCTHNAARSQLAVALWRDRTGTEARSAGTAPAATLAEGARRVARRHGLVLDDVRPRHLREVSGPFGLVVSVCDRARESGQLPTGEQRHWSVPDPAGGRARDFERAYEQLAVRVDRLAAEVRP